MKRALDENNYTAAVHYDEIFNTLKMPYSLLQLGIHRIQVPEELWEMQAMITD